ncbi:MAG: IclR family transcriptional regulator [Alphaproteobacteria bacterium]
MPPDGKHQNTRRITAVLDAIARHADQGMRLVDVTRATGLGKGTAHRIIAGLLDSQMVEQDPDSGRFFIGLRVMNWAASGRKRFGLVEQLKPVLQAICEQSGDTVYLTVRQGDEVVYIDRREGSYPLKALPVDVGARRPLGIGAAPTAILAFQDDEEIRRIVETHEEARLGFGIGRAKLEELIALARRLGYALHQGEILPGMVAVGVPVLNAEGVPFAAISVAAGAARLAPPRTDEIAELIKREIAGRHILPG